MVWNQLEPSKAHVAYACVGVFSSVFSLVSLFIKERLYIGESMVAGIFGLIVGPHCLNWFSPISWGNSDSITLEITRIVLCLQVFAVAVELPRKYMLKHWLSVTMLLVPVMTFGWLIIGLFVWILIPGLNFSHSLLVAACITATDPILAQSVVSGKFAERVPGHLRNLLSAESGCNDGLAFPFIFLSLNLIMYPSQGGEIVKNWICLTLLWECLFGCLLGCVIGYCGRRAIRFAEKLKIIDRESFLAFYVVLTFMCAGFGSILGVDDLLTSFSAGAAFAWDGWFSESTKESHVSTVIDVLLNYAYFVYFGAIIPWEYFNDPEIGANIWRLIILSVVVIFLRRIPAVLLLKPLIPDIKSWREAMFVGHFGPIGVGAVFAAITARGHLESQDSHEETPLRELPPKGAKHWQIIALIWPITCFFIITSIIVHGSSVAIITLGRHLNTITLTKTFTTHTTNGNGKISWMQRLPSLEKSGRSFSLQRVDTEAPSFSGQTVVETSGIPYTPAGGMRKRRRNRKSNRRKELLHALSGNGTNEDELNDLGRERLQREKEARAATFALSTAAGSESGAPAKSEDFSPGTSESITPAESEGLTAGQSDITDQEDSHERVKTDLDIMSHEETVHAISDLDQLARDGDNGDIDLVDKVSFQMSRSATSRTDASHSDIEEKGRRDSLGNASRTSSEAERMKQIKEEEQRAHIAYTEDDQVIVENAEGEVVDEVRLNKPKKDEEKGRRTHLSPTVSTRSSDSLHSLKKVLTPPLNSIKQYGRKSSRANKYFAYKMDDQLIIEDNDGEVLRRYKINSHDVKKNQADHAKSGGVVQRALFAVGLSNRAGPNNQEDSSPPAGELNKMVRNPTPAPKEVYRRPEELEDDDEDVSDSDEEETGGSYDYSDDSAQDDGDEVSSIEDSDGEEFETAVERERRLNALGHLSAPRDQDDEEEPPTPLVAQQENKTNTAQKVKNSIGRKFHFK